MSFSFDAPHQAVVVGACGAIGRAVCRAYRDAGAGVIAADQDGEGLESLLNELGPKLSASRLDVTDRNAVARLARSIDGGRVDSLCYAVGIAPTFELSSFDWEAYRQTIAVNLDGALHVAAAFSPLLVAAGGGSMTFVSSMAGKRGAAGASAYSASKFALIGVVDSLAGELGRNGLRVNAVCPGEVDSPMLRRVASAQAARRGTDPDDELAAWAAASALGRLVRPEEVAAVVVWLSSELASALTATAIDVTGGLGVL